MLVLASFPKYRSIRLLSSSSQGRDIIAFLGVGAIIRRFQLRHLRATVVPCYS
jgi:hypothetical protein